VYNESCVKSVMLYDAETLTEKLNVEIHGESEMAGQALQ